MDSGVIWSLVLAAAAAAVYFFQRSAGPRILPQQAPSPATWTNSENGNPTRIYKGKRITVFEADGGWKYCIADPEDRREPYFSEPYETSDIGKSEAIRHIERLPSMYRSLPEQRREIRRQKEDEDRATFLSTEPQIIASLASSAEAAPNLTELRKVERKADTRKRYIDRVIESVEIYGTDEDMGRARELQQSLNALVDRIQVRVAELKGRSRTSSNRKER